jgi:undecaprenyl-diphosphatase
MINSLLTFDTSTTKFFHDILPHVLAFNKLFTFLSVVGNSFLPWLLIIVIVMYLEERKDKRFILYFLISFFVTAIFVNIVLKNVFTRPRPPVPTTVHAVYTCPTDFCFPSGLASSSFAAAVVFSAFDRKRRYLYYLTAFLISYSRIYLGCHYFLDVITGGFLGSFISLLILRFGLRAEKSVK